MEPKIWHLEKMKAKLKCWFETFDFNLPKSQTKRIKPKYFASVIKLKDLKSMIFEHQTISLRSLGFWSHSNPRNKKPHMKRKKERKKKKKTWFWSLKMKKNKKREFTPWSLQKQSQFSRASTSSSLDHLENQNWRDAKIFWLLLYAYMFYR